MSHCTPANRAAQGSALSEPGGIQAALSLVRQMRERTLAAGGSEQQAWRSAVGAYLEVHPGADLFTAERIVTCLLRPPPPTGPSSALG